MNAKNAAHDRNPIVDEIWEGVKALNEWLEANVSRNSTELFDQKGHFAWNIGWFLVGLNSTWPGPGRWRFEKVEARLVKDQIIYEGRLEVFAGGEWVSTGTQHGGANARAKGGIADAMKIARADALKKAFSELSAGYQAYVGNIAKLRAREARQRQGAEAEKNEASKAQNSTGNQHADKANAVRAEVLKQAKQWVGRAVAALPGANETQALEFGWGTGFWERLEAMPVGEIRSGIEKLKDEVDRLKTQRVDPETGEILEDEPEREPGDESPVDLEL